MDQLLIGWYAQFALEALAEGVPTVCFIDDRYKQLYSEILVTKGASLPFIESDIFNLTQTLEYFYTHRGELARYSILGNAYLRKFHSLEVIGAMFLEIADSVSEL